MQIIYKKINELIPYINNSRTHSDEQINQICASINEYGWTNPVLIDEKGMIIAGHGRVEAGKKLNIKEVPCIVLSGLTEAQKKAYVIADNKMALNAGWNEDLLKTELENLKELDFDLELTGFNIDELDELFKEDEEKQEIVEDDFDIEPSEEPKAKLGDIYQLGNHRLMCGDSTKIEDVEKLMNGNKADTVFTDPPYDFTECNYNKSIENSTKNANIFIMNDDENMVRYLRKSNLKFKKFFVANFGFASPRGNDAYLQHILVSHEINGEARKVLNLNDGFRSILKMEYRGRLKDEHTTHKHQKSLKFISEFLTHYQAENVLDLFGGSGSTLMVCEQMNINCFMMELEPKYIDVIIERWEKLTGKKAVKIKGSDIL